jgi:hypothetical protein
MIDTLMRDSSGLCLLSLMLMIRIVVVVVDMWLLLLIALEMILYFHNLYTQLMINYHNR